MAGKVLNLQARKDARKRKSKNGGTPEKETVMLWQLSESIDDSIRFAVLDQKLKTEEVAAILAHRLGTLINLSESPEKLVEFCVQLVKNLTDKEGSSNAS